MRKLQLLTAMAIGISASAIGAIQVEAIDYTYFVDFSTKTVANFNDYTPSILPTTYNLNNTIQWTLNTKYKMNSCPPSVAADPYLDISYRLNNSGTTYFAGTQELPNMPCTTSFTQYQITKEFTINQTLLNALIIDDANFITFNPLFVIRSSSSAPGRIVTLENPEWVFTINYEFGTTYLFNYFLSDSQYVSNFGTNTTLTGTIEHDFDYVMTSAGNDRYFIINSDSTNYGTTRTKFAIDYNMEYFRGESIGARYKMITDGTIDFNVSSALAFFYPRYNYYYLNAANNSQALVDAPEFNFTYEDCGWDVFDIPCFINNGLAYITNDAPIISDAITLLNAGIAMAAQTFGIIGAFTTDNVFGYLILAGFGFVAVRWFLKND